MHPILAIRAFFRVLAHGEAAPAALEQAPKPTFSTSPEPAAQLLALLQKEGRLVDFLQEDIKGYTDADVGAAVRDIHRGCREALAKYFALRRLSTLPEGSPIEVPADFDRSAYELRGNVAGPGPYRGVVLHPGWYVDEVKLPTVPPAADPKVVAPTQVEVR
jgi:hypothetical protein